MNQAAQGENRRPQTEAGIDKLAPHDLRRYTECKTMPNVVTGSTSVTLLTTHDSA
jgi:hypothetical protein